MLRRVIVRCSIVGWLSYLTFYSALAIGPISLVSPIVSGYAACTVLVAVIAGQSVGPLQAIAVAVTFAGVMLSSAAEQVSPPRQAGARTLGGVGLGLVAMVLFGGFVYGVSAPRGGVSWLAALFLARAFTACLFVAQTGSRRRPRRTDLAWGTVALVGLIGLLDTGGYVCFDLGVRRAATVVIATASAPYALIPVAVGVWLLHERLRTPQRIGLALVGCGLIALGVST